MNEIKFSHDYFKLPSNWEDTEATLIIADSQILKNIDPDFLDYDTAFQKEVGNYKIKDGPVIILLFYIKNFKWLFTTIRPFTSEKFAYYVGQVGQPFTLRRI